MEGKDDPDNRRDFPGGFAGDSRDAFQSNGRTRDEERMWEWTRDWIKLRREHSALRDGQLIDLFYDDDAYVFARQDQNETVVIAMNRSKKEKEITIPARAIGLKDGAEFAVVIGTSRGSRVMNGGTLLILGKSSSSAFVAR
jgi:glycosidase